MLFVPPVEFHGFEESMKRTTEAVLEACDGITIYVGFLSHFIHICAHERRPHTLKVTMRCIETSPVERNIEFSLVTLVLIRMRFL